MANPFPNHGVNLPDDEQVQLELVPALHGFAPAVLDIPNNNNGWIEEELEEDLEMKEEEEEEEKEEEEEEEKEMDIEDEMDDPEIIYPYEIEEGKLPPLPADSDTSSDSEPEVEAEDEDRDEATVGTITRASYSVPPFSCTIYVGSGSSRKVFGPFPIGNNVDMLHRKVKGLAQQMFDRANTEYSTLKRLGEMDRYLSGISTERRSEAREHYKLKQSVSTLEDQMRGLMLEDKEEKERLKKKLRVSQQEKKQIEQSFRQWNSQMATLGLNVAIGKSWGDMKKMMLEEFCPDEEFQLRRRRRLKHTLKVCQKTSRERQPRPDPLTLMRNNNPRGNYQGNNRHEQYNNQRQGNTRALTNSPAEQVGYKGHKPICNNCKKQHNGNCEATFHNCGRLGHFAKDCRRRSTPVCYECGEKGHTQNYCPKKNNPQGEEARGQAYVIKEADKDQGRNVVMEQDAVIVCGKKVVHVPYKNKTLVVEGDRGASRLKVVSCIKARKFIKRGSQLFVAHVTEKEP
nr:reverse transcriptase domain-containing protein [Tanacetum cinerariifolium]